MCPMRLVEMPQAIILPDGRAVHFRHLKMQLNSWLTEILERHFSARNFRECYEIINKLFNYIRIYL